MKKKVALILITLSVMTSGIDAYAVPIAGSTKAISEAQQEAGLKPPVAGWQQDILDIMTEKPEETHKNAQETHYIYAGENTLNKRNGVFYGPSGKESYYNLPMMQVVKYMQDLGYTDRYWIRSDGVKMLGNYVMVAADLRIRPKGTILQTSLGPAMVCDTGEFINSDSHALDVAVSW